MPIGLLAALFTQAAPADADLIEDVVVTARPGPTRPLPDAVDHLRRLCFDPLRLTGRFAPPEDDADWRALSKEVRGRFGAADPSVPAYGLSDPVRGHTLLAKFERLPRNKHWGVVEERCTIVVIGGRDHARLRDEMGALFGASGTQRHVGDRQGASRLPGWDQWMWSGMPARGARRWTALKPGRGNESAYLNVVDPGFYDRFDYILGDLKTRVSGAPLSVLTLAWTTRETGKGGPDRDRPSDTTTIRVDQKSR